MPVFLQLVTIQKLLTLICNAIIRIRSLIEQTIKKLSNLFMEQLWENSRGKSN